MESVRNLRAVLGVHTIALAAALFLVAPARADLGRVESPTTLALTIGSPAPSWLGGVLGIQLNETFQLTSGAGFFWLDEINVRAIGGGLRVHILRSNFTPMFGGGLSFLLFEGSGQIQGLEETALLGTLMTGIDWAIASRVRISAGVNFHFPISLNFPFLELGLIF